MPGIGIEAEGQAEQLQAWQAGDQWQQQGDCPDGHAGNQAADEAAPIGLWPIEHRQGAGQKLYGSDEGGDAQVGQILLGTEQAIEAITGHDDRRN